MKPINRPYWLLLSLLLLLLLCGCAAETAPRDWAPQVPSPSPVLEAQPATVSYPMETEEGIRIFFPGNGEIAKVLQEAEDYIGIGAEYMFAADFQSALMQMFNSGDCTDLFFGYGQLPIQIQVSYPDAPMDLSEVIGKYAPNYLALVREDPILSSTAFDGDSGEMHCFYQIYDGPGLPLYGPFIRSDWLAQVGMEVPTTYEEYHDVLVAFRDQIGCKEPLAMRPNGAIPGDFLAAGFGVTASVNGGNLGYQGFYLQDGAVKYGPAEPGFVDYVTMLQQWHEEDLFSGDFVSIRDESAYQKQIRHGDTGLFYCSFTSLRGFVDEIMDGGTIIPIPDAVKNKGDLLHLGEQDNSRTGPATMSVWAESEKAELCVRWCDFWYSELGSTLVNYAEPTPIDPAEVDQSERCTYLPGVYDRTLFPFWTAGQDFGTYEVWAPNRDNAWRIPTDLKLSTQDREQYYKYIMDLNSAVSSWCSKVILGEETADSHAAFVQQLYDFGLQECIDCLTSYLK